MTRTISRIFAIAGLVCLVAAPIATAQLAQVDMGSADVLFHPNLGAAEWTLTVHTPDGVFTETFQGDETPSFALRSVAGVDGAYQWELVRTPDFSANHQAEMAEARANGVMPKSAGEILVRQSGTFTVFGGAIVTEELTEAPASGPTLASAGAGTAGSGSATAGSVATKDQFFADDVIVDGSLCVGTDCVNGENFGFDTIRLKENNLRIHFDDTSSSGSFPNVDWRLTANDTNNGGANYFRIEDSTNNKQPFRVDANADNNSVRILPANSGNPRVAIGADSSNVTVRVVDGNTPTLRLEQDGSSGFSSQIWDLAGNEANFFIRDITNSSKLPFRIKPGAPTDSIFIKADGSVGIGSDAPTDKLHVINNTDANVFATVQNENTGSGAAAVVKVNADGSGMNFIAHGSGRTVSRFGETLGGWNELLAFSGNGLIIGPSNANSRLILGTEGVAALEIDANQDILYRGNGGSSVIHADYVFEPSYALPTMEEQADHMFSAKHLPAIGPAQVGEDGREFVRLGSDRRGIVEELEKAHIYISQLNERLKEKSDEVESLNERLERLEKAIDGSVE
jgi:hypothetical protein